MDVKKEEFAELGLCGWSLVSGPGPNGEYWLDYAGKPMKCPTARIRPIDTRRSTFVTFLMLQQISKLFETKNIDVNFGCEADLSDLTPGAGCEIEISVSVSTDQ